MIEKQQPYQEDHEWKAEEKNTSFTSESLCETKGLEREIVVTKMIHKEVAGSGKKDMKSHTDEFPSRISPRETDVGSEPSVIQSSENADLLQAKSQNKASPTSDPDAESDAPPGSHQMKERKASKTRKKRRPQSLNLGMPAEFIHSNTGSDSSEENEKSDLDSSEKPCKRGIHEDSFPIVMQQQCDPRVMLTDDPIFGEDRFVRAHDERIQDDLPSGESREMSTQGTEKVKKKVNQVGKADADSGSLNGPGNIKPDNSLPGVNRECLMKMQGKALIDNKELAEVKLRQVRTHERKISSTGGEDIEGFMGDRGQRTCLHRPLGSSHQSEITRIVPLKPEQFTSVAPKDEKDQTGQEEHANALRREYRWSIGSPEGSSDLTWTEVPTFNTAMTKNLEGVTKTDPDDGLLAGRGTAESQAACSKSSALPKMTPPAPPVKTKKARESGLILRNSRNASREPSLDAAKKRHSVTRAWHALSVTGNAA